MHCEDTEQLGCNTTEAWRESVERNVTKLAEAQKIDVSNLQWYGAFHDIAHHPHMHLLVYSKDARQGWLTKIRKGAKIWQNTELVPFSPKTENLVQLVSIPQEAVDLPTMEHSKPPTDLHMFPSLKTGEMYHPNSIVNLHKRILKSAGLGRLKFHELRCPNAKPKTKNFQKTENSRPCLKNSKG